ncbi:MAG: methyltransferase domain-containing protein [Planctomycetota bacterium]|nr:MAG: methyltransferase domain-containing protein [Planctomycetota bacterium]
MRIVFLRAICTVSLVALPLGCDHPPSPAQTGYEQCEASADGIGRTYYGREIAAFMSHQGIYWLERGTRESEERTDLLMDALDLKPGMTVADIGAGSGYFTVPMAKRVAPGIVYGTDIQPEMLAFLEARSRTEKLTNIKGILGDTGDAMLPVASVDLVLLVDAYHEFDQPLEMMTSIARALKPGGRVALVEYRGEDPEVPIKPLHKMTEAQARRELEAAGLVWIRTDAQLPMQHLMWFGKFPSDA